MPVNILENTFYIEPTFAGAHGAGFDHHRRGAAPVAREGADEQDHEEMDMIGRGSARSRSGRRRRSVADPEEEVRPSLPRS